MKTRPLSHGFTLLEMAIVLLIISLAAGGILAGRTMIRAAQVREAMGEYDIYLKSIKEFQDKYQALPGDMTGATTIWGTDASGCPNNTASTTPQTKTCDGDGDGRIGTSSSAAVLSNQTEWWRAWQQLADAGFIKGAYTGVLGTTGNASEAKIGVNVPASQLSGAGWTLNYYLYPNNGTNSNTGAPLWMDQYGHLLHLGGFVSANYSKGGIMTPTEAQSVDQKIDDGMPGTGNIRTWRTSILADCITGDGDANQASATYKTTYTSGNACSLFFLTGI